MAGDGATFDIGMICISGAFERGHDFTYICYDNEAYMNTGIQRSGATPYDASTTTSPAGSCSFGNKRPKKDMPAILAAHGAPYVATASIAYPADLKQKVEKAINTPGPCYVQVHAPCCTGWGFEGDQTIAIAKLAIETGLWVNFEMVDGKVTKVKKVVRKPVEEYLKDPETVPPPLQAKAAGCGDRPYPGNGRPECREVRPRYQTQERIKLFFSPVFSYDIRCNRTHGFY